MKSVLHTGIGAAVGLAVALVLVIAVELFSSVVHPIPANLAGNIPEHVRRYPQWVLAVVVPMWGATALAAAWVAARLGNRTAGLVVTVLLVCALLFNLSMLPYVMWFKIVMPVALVAACIIGVRHGTRAAPAS